MDCLERRISRLLLLCLWVPVLGAGALGACEEEVTPCDEYERFVEDVGLATCPGLAWDCETRYPELDPEHQQDFDWCVDCIRLRNSEDEHADLDCSEAPLSGRACGALLDETLDASCFTEPSSAP